MQIRPHFDSATSTLTYVVWDEATRDAVVIDPVLDFDPHNWRVSTDGLDAVAALVREESLRVRWVLDTHVHADHLSGMHALKARVQASTAIGDQIAEVQKVFGDLFNLSPEAIPRDGRQFDTLLADGQRLDAGGLTVTALHTPGHTPACMSYLIDDAVFTGDVLFMPDYGTGRCDFPGGSADALYTSVTDTLYALPDDTRVFVGHDYQPGGRPMAFETTIGASKASNIHLPAGRSREDFIAFRQARDATLRAPRLLMQSLQVNIRAGQLPPAEDNGRSYLKMPLRLDA